MESPARKTSNAAQRPRFLSPPSSVLSSIWLSGLGRGQSQGTNATFIHTDGRPILSQPEDFFRSVLLSVLVKQGLPTAWSLSAFRDSGDTEGRGKPPTSIDHDRGCPPEIGEMLREVRGKSSI